MERRRVWTLALLGASALLLVLLAAGLHDVQLQPGRPLPFDLFRPFQFGGGSSGSTRVTLPSWLPAALAIGSVVTIIGLIVSPRLRRDLLRNLPAYLLFALGVYLIGKSIERSAPGAAEVSPIGPPAAEPPLVSPTARPEVVSQPPEWLVTGLTLLIIGALLGVAALLLRRALRQPPAPLLDQIVDEARDALAGLRSGADLRDTISRCYIEMVRLLSERRGIARDATLTPREFEQRLAAIGLGDAHIRRLTRLFERVRYSPHMPGPAEEHEAEACLDAIVSTYR